MGLDGAAARPAGPSSLYQMFFETSWQCSDGDLHNGGVKCRGYEKIAILDPSLYLRNDTVATVTMQLLWTPPLWRSPLEHIPKLSNGTIFDDLERPLTKISRLRHYLTLNISETVHEIQT